MGVKLDPVQRVAIVVAYCVAHKYHPKRIGEYLDMLEGASDLRSLKNVATQYLNEEPIYVEAEA